MAEQPEIRYLGDVQRLRLAPGDVIVVKTADFLTGDQAWRIRDHVRSILGDDRKVIILSGGMEIGVLSPGDDLAEA